jgi:hypothetical protein
MDQLTVLEELGGRWDFGWPMCFGCQIDEKNLRWYQVESRARRLDEVACVSE